jgi:hypothetical protein
MPTADTLFAEELDNMIGRYKIRIEQQRIHAKELSGDPSQQKHARAQLAGITAGLAKLKDLRKQFTEVPIATDTPTVEATSALRTALSGSKG